MRKKILFVLVVCIIVALCFCMVACEKISLPSGDYSKIFKRPAPQMYLSNDGEFKILQLSDLHLVGGKNKDDKKTLEALDKTLKNTKYDLVIFTGDLFDGFTNRAYDKPSAVKNLIEVFDKNNQPFTLVMGNNDGEYLGTPQDVICMLATSANFIYSDTENVGGVGNFYIKLHDSQNIEKHRLVIIDSRMRDEDDVYIHMDDSQTQFYNKMADECKQLNIKLSVFIHIPFNNMKNVINQGNALQGDLSINNIHKFYDSTNNNTPMHNAIEESGVCGLIASGHMHTIDIAKEYKGIYYKITRAAGYYLNLQKGVKPGGAEIIINANGKVNSDIYSFHIIDF